MSETPARILLVDDDPGLRRLLSLRLRAAGWAVETAADGEQALARLPVWRPQVVVSDLRMPGMDGMTLFEALHREHPALPVILLTAHGSIPEAVSATQRGVFGFLTKPFDSEALLERIREALRMGGGWAADGPADEDWRAEIRTCSARMEDVLAQARLVARSEASVFIHGESGTGKELVARAIHRASPRRDRAFVALNCSAVPEALFESELFGHRKGAFTGATRDHEGLLRAADGGTLFLDEVGDMPLAFQAKLLRVLQEQQVRAVGATDDAPVDVRVLSATHRDLPAALRSGDFREDLYYRLNVVGLRLPPLRERREDVPLLARHFLSRLAERYRGSSRDFSPEAMDALVRHDWPGNVRQLYNVVEQVLALTPTGLIPVSAVERALQAPASRLPSLAEARRQAERDYLVQTLRLTGGNVSRAARLAQRNRTDFYKLLHRHHLDPGAFKSPA
jgi:two-component system response regulator GlrR